MKVVRKDPGEKPRIISLENTLSALQKAVGGYIETVTFCSNAAIVCNEEGRLLGMAHNCRVLGIDFVGTILVVGVEGCEMRSLTEKEAAFALQILGNPRDTSHSSAGNQIPGLI